MKINLDPPGTDVRIEIIPLIDVIFCILTFFILAALGLTRQQAISLELPRASTGAPQMREMLVVSIDPVGQTYVEKEPVNRDQLKQILLNYQRTQPNGLMVLNAAQVVSYNEVVQVLDLLRSVGGNRVALATLPSNPTSPSPSPSPSLLPTPPALDPLLTAPQPNNFPSPIVPRSTTPVTPAPINPN
ncbi:MAG TPA: biopolymer transporter ExbD [Candidatus Caenarcaniphilales bacterium]